MKASELYEKLDKDFIKPTLSDDWATRMESIEDFLTENFKKRSMGLVCDFTKEVNKIYTAVFPSRKIMKKILDDDIENAMFFVHHPMIWDIRKAPNIFENMDRDLLKYFKDKQISIYNLHVPLDNFSEFSTSVTLAKSLDIKPEKPFAPYFGSLCGVFGKTDLTTIQELRRKFESSVGHEVILYNYGDDNIKNRKVALVGGGGNEIDILKEIVEEKVNTFVTGVTVKNDYSKNTHEFAEKNRINILGGTHYSTEKFACISMRDYFEKIDLPSEFIEDEPVLEDM